MSDAEKIEEAILKLVDSVDGVRLEIASLQQTIAFGSQSADLKVLAEEVALVSESITAASLQQVATAARPVTNIGRKNRRPPVMA